MMNTHYYLLPHEYYSVKGLHQEKEKIKD